MTTPAKKVPLSGSHRDPVPGSHPIGPIHPEERIEVTVRIRPRAPISDDVKSRTMQAQSPRHRAYMTHAQLATNHGASPEDIAKVVAFATAHNLAVVHTSEARRSVWLSGTAADFSAAFDVPLQEYGLPEGGTYRGRTGPIQIPADLDGIVVGIFGLDNRPQARPHFRIRTARSAAAGPKAEQTQFTAPQVAQLYDFPTEVTGSGQCIGIIELGGGYKTADLMTYFSGLGLTAPSVSSVSVDQGKNSPTGSADGPDGEVMLDIEVAGAVAPGAKIVVYFCPNTAQGFLDGDDAGRPRHHEQALGDLDQLGRPRVELDRPVHGTVRPGLPGRRRPGHLGLRRLPETTGRATASATAWPTSTSPPPARTSWPAAARPSTSTRAAPPSPTRLSGTTAPTVVPPGAASATSSPCRATSKMPAYRPRRIPAARSAAACPTSPPTPTRIPATPSASTAATQSSGAPAPSPRSGRASSPCSTSHSATRSDSSTPSSTAQSPRRASFATSPAATTAPTPPSRLGRLLRMGFRRRRQAAGGPGPAELPGLLILTQSALDSCRARG